MNSGAALERELYVYWKTASAEPALAAVRQAQGLLEAEYVGLHARALRCEDPGATTATVMEIYVHAGGIDSMLQAVIDERLTDATDGLRAGPRHTEVFVGA